MCSHNHIKLASSNQIVGVRTIHFTFHPVVIFAVAEMYCKSLSVTGHIRWASLLLRVKLQAQRWNTDCLIWIVTTAIRLDLA